MTVHKGDIIRIQKDYKIIQGKIIDSIESTGGTVLQWVSTPVGDVLVDFEGGDFDIIEKATRVPTHHDVVVDDGDGDKWVRMFNGQYCYQLVFGSMTLTPEEFAESYPEWCVVYALD